MRVRLAIWPIKFVSGQRSWLKRPMNRFSGGLTFSHGLVHIQVYFQSIDGTDIRCLSCKRNAVKVLPQTQPVSIA